jgi:oxygen-independent coproporphyrinogen-3 oxidase
MDSFGIYVHVPYCRTICPYCDFNVYARKEHPWAQLALSVQREIKRRASLFEHQPVGTIYFGGGTPSLAPPSFFSAIIKAIRERFTLLEDSEISIEVNPGTIAPGALEGWRAAGINRLSLGWQSTRSSLMKTLGRDHSVEESMAAFEQGRHAGFDNISLDLIFGVPGQKLSDLRADLSRIETIQPDHVSIYEMTFHEGTPYARYLEKKRFARVPDERVFEMTLLIEESMKASGFEHYEVSNFAKPGKRSGHNQRYWTGSSFLGLGPGAHSFVRDGWQSGHRWEARRAPERYFKAMEDTGEALPHGDDGSAEFCDALNARQLLNERIMTGVRLADGLDLEPWLEGEFASDIAVAKSEALLRGWLVEEASRIQATPEGRRYADSLASLFF